MIQLAQAGKRFGRKLLFEGLDWMLTPHDRVGIVGANGSGKSTLLKVLAGIEPLDSGQMQAARGASFGYLPQDGLSLSGRSVFAECMQVFADLRHKEVEMEALTRRMAELAPESDGFREVSERFHRLEHEFRAHDGYALEAKVGAVLNGLGFSKQDWQRRTEEFSGGWQMRIALAKLLLEQPELLLLDEPTNHLDLETRNWLEQYLLDYPHAYVVISHDRYFLDVTVDRILEIWNQRVHFYPGNYEKYLEQKQQRREQLEAAQRNQQIKIDQLKTFIERFRYKASKAKQVQSRIKELERMKKIEVPEDEKSIHFKFPQPKPSGRSVVEAKGLSKSYGDHQVFADVSFVIERGDRIALVGPNGAGKSTLIKLLSGAEPATAGELRLGHNVETDYFAQDQYKELNISARVLDDLSALAPRATQTELRNLLGCFLFSADDVFKPIGVLSGGERNRYALARLLLHPSNLLLLDEPTNHLDLRAKDVLLAALQEFSGTLVVVSHDRYFIDRLATRIFEIGDGGVNVYPGNYEDYLWRKGRSGEQPMTQTQIVTSSNRAAEPGSNGAASSSSVPAVAESDSPARPRRINPIKLRQMQERHEAVEEEIVRVEAAIRECEESLMTFVSAEETRRQTELLATRKSQLQQLMTEWEELSAVLESSSS